MKLKKLKPTSSHFLSQNIWRFLRGILGRNLWTFLYKISQKIKIYFKISFFQDKDFKLKKNLNYFTNKKSRKIRSQTYSFFLKKYESSKPEGNYRIFLDNFFYKIKKNVNTILEIGISQGAGILSLRDYFSNSLLWGIDIDKKTFLKRERIVKCFWGDQLKLDTLYKCAENFNTKFDLVVDDGWHHPEAQLNSIIAFLPYLNINGHYIVEDIVHKDYSHLFKKIIKILKKKIFL